MKDSFNDKDNFEKKDSAQEKKQTVLNSRIIQKLGDMFNPEPQTEKVLRHEDFAAAGDTYYASVSVGYKISQRVFTLILVVFLVFSLEKSLWTNK